LPKDLVIVESPAKARTVGRFLGKDFDVKASMGHVRDLPSSDLGVDVENGFAPTYVDVEGRQSVIRDIKKSARAAGKIYLATDPDREGEAISWHLLEAAGLGRKPVHRVVFHEITRGAIDEAFADPREIDMRLVNAQQARRILDRIVGYRLSPVLWSKIKRGLSAGRVQSVALRLIVDREREVLAFTPEEYWVIKALLSGAAKPETRFSASLHAIEGQTGRLRVANAEDAGKIVDDLQSGEFEVASVETKERKTRPAAPFITSTMQQEAARRLGMTAERTMRTAQALYEGIDVGDGEQVGLITYMRTDSTNLSAESLSEAIAFIKKQYGPEYAGRPRTYKTRSKSAQEAHEAIRPTSVHRTPDSVKSHLNRDQSRLYELIWNRMVASQMNDAISDATVADIAVSGTSSGTGYVVRARGTVLKFPGFRTLYIEARDDAEAEDEDSSELVPLTVGETLKREDVLSEQKFTQPPPRFTEAMLIRTLEELGIGRPSTFASIVATIARRDYVTREKQRFLPTNLGMAVSDFLTEHFPDIMDPGFTSGMEENLDSIARGESEWVPMLQEFFGPFQERVTHTKENAERVDRNKLVDPSDEVCEKCERPMVIRDGRYGKFLSCSGFPDCRNSKPIRVVAEAPCPNDGGELLQRRSKKGRAFFGCANYPDCDFATSRTPLKEPCPVCGGLLTERGRGAQCNDQECGWRGARPGADGVESEAEPVEV
jgi:DNA topoisomerase I